MRLSPVVDRANPAMLLFQEQLEQHQKGLEHYLTLNLRLRACFRRLERLERLERLLRRG